MPFQSTNPVLFTRPPHCAQGGFQPEMNRREAALILGLRETAAEERIKDAHRRIMVANHPDSGEKCDKSDGGVHRRIMVANHPDSGEKYKYDGSDLGGRTTGTKATLWSDFPDSGWPV